MGRVAGFRVRLTEHANIGESLKAGPPDLRAADLHAVFSDSEVDAICPLAGGHPAPGVLRCLDYDLIGQNPKPFVASSELTVLHVPLLQKAGLVTFYGPMVSSLDVTPAPDSGALAGRRCRPRRLNTPSSGGRRPRGCTAL